jgi:recombination endonuclease VII
MKTCTTCHEQKPLSAFGKHAAGLHGKRAVCKVCNALAAKAYKEKNPAKVKRSIRNSVLKRQYGITLAEYEVMLAAQEGVCGICRQPPTRTLHVDHDHRTGDVRGLLCFSCNTALGFFDDEVARFHAAANYLERSRDAA